MQEFDTAVKKEIESIPKENLNLKADDINNNENTYKECQFIDKENNITETMDKSLS